MSQKAKGRRFSKEFRESAVRRLGETANVAELCRELGISRQLLYWWRDRQQRKEHNQFLAAEQRLRQENAELKKALVKKTLEADFLKAACEKIEALRRSAAGSGETASGKPSAH